MSDDSRHPVDLLAEEFADRLRAGEVVTVDEYLAKYPEHAPMIGTIFPSIAMVERVTQREEQAHKTPSPQSVNSLAKNPPESLGDFQIVREIGRGGMGVVYEAIQRSLKRSVALKVVGTLAAGSEAQRERFRREAESAAGLHHTNIVPVFGIGEDHGLQYYAMQLIDGVPLSDVVDHLKEHRSNIVNGRTKATRQHATTASIELTEPNSQPSKVFGASDALRLLLGRAGVDDSLAATRKSSTPMYVAETMTIVLPAQSGTDQSRESTGSEVGALNSGASEPQGLPDKKMQLGSSYYRKIASLVANVASALEHAHHHGVLHRDIKPGNLLLDRDGTVWISDFGLARKAQIDNITQTGEIVGTLRYMAPEQLRGQFDARSDIYSLGATLYELLTLRPVNESPQIRLASGGKTDRLVHPRSIRPDISADLETITLKACSWEPEHRYRSAAQLEHDLHCFLEDRPISARPITTFERLWRWSKRNPALASLSLATLSLLLAMAAILAYGYRQKQLAFEEIGLQFARAEANLSEKTSALQSTERERVRAETNLDLAIQAFEEIIDNISSRGGAESLLGDLDEDAELLASADAMLSSADVDLLKLTLKFFDRFSQENSKDLSLESAKARLRVGDIQHQLGNLEDAHNSYKLALQTYSAIARQHPEDHTLILTQAGILNSLMTICAKRGDMVQAIARHEEARKLLESSAAVRSSKEGRFALAKTLNSLASLGSRFGFESVLRPRRPFGRFLPIPDRPPLNFAPAQKMRMQRQEDSNREALDLLLALAVEDERHVGYRSTLARAYRDNVRIAQFNQDFTKANQSLASAVKLLDALCVEHAESDPFKYQLADTLCTPLFTRQEDSSRFSRALALCDELIASQPNVPEYRALRATALVRTAEYQFTNNRPDRSDRAIATLHEALAVQKSLADQFPDVLLYHISLLQSLQRIADVQVARKDDEAALRALDDALVVIQRFKGNERMRMMFGPHVARLRERRDAIQKRSIN